MSSFVTMWKARYTNPYTGQVQIVQVPGSKLEPGATYYHDQTQKGHLICAHCDAGVHFNEGTISVSGSSFKGRAAHFVTNKDQQHQKCVWDFKDPSQTQKDVDYTKGYRLHINTQQYSELFNNEATGVYRRTPEGQTLIVDPDMRNRERVTIKSADDIVTLLERGDFERAASSRVVFRNIAQDWDQFCIRYGRSERFLDLVSRLQSLPKGKDLPFCLMEIRTSRRYSFRGFEKKMDVASLPIPMKERDVRGLPQEIRPTVQILNRHNTHVMGAFNADEGNFFVLGQVSYNKFEGDHKTIHYLNIRVTDPEQTVQANIENIFRKGLERSMRRRADGGKLGFSPS